MNAVLVRNGAARWCVVAMAMTCWAPAAAAGEPPRTDAPSPTVTGGSGLFRLSTTDIGEARSLRLALYGELSRASDFLVFGDTNTKAAGDLAAGLTVHRHIELFAALRGAWNRSHQDATPASSATVSTIGSGTFTVGAKAAAQIWRALAGGVELGARLPFDPGSWPGSGAAWIDLLATSDLRARWPSLPLRVHGSAGFIADGSNNQIDFAGQSAAARQLAMFARGMGRSRIRAAVGLDAPLARLQPFFEYHYELVTVGPDPALSDQTPNFVNQIWLTFGLRARAGAGVTLIGGVDVSVSSFGFPYGPPLPPWNAFAGAAWPLPF